MDGFDTLTMTTMSYMGNPMPVPNGLPPDQMHGIPLLPLDNIDHSSTFDSETFAGYVPLFLLSTVVSLPCATRLPSVPLLTPLCDFSSEDATPYAQRVIHPPPAPGSLRRFPSQYDETFSDAMSAYDHPNHHDHNGADSPEIDSNNKLLSFSMPVFNYTLLDYAFGRTHMNIGAQLHGMFFLAESPWATSGDASAPPTELTCYRRNLFQITGEITMPRTLRYIMTEAGEQIPIVAQELTISATESVEGNPVKIISVPWKTPAANAPAHEDKTEKEPSAIPLDVMNGQDIDSEFVNIPIAWKRLQFRIATANNGRRKELQQHFLVKLKVMATLATGNKVPICEVQSGAIIVRGRSPRNFQSRKDHPIGGGSSARKQHIQQPSRTSTGDSMPQPQNNVNVTPERPTSSRIPDVPTMPFKYEPADFGMSADFWDFKTPGQTGAMTALPQEPAFSVASGGVAPYAQSSPDFVRHGSGGPQLSRPAPPAVSLSLTEDEPRKSASPSNSMSRKAPRLSQSHGSGPRPSFSINLISSPDESADLLYEYFPLGLDDWMPPVDAVYRPHVVHHTNLPKDPKAVAVKNKSKRYFSSDTP